MNALKQLNLLVSFLLELAMLYFFSLWAFRTGESVIAKYSLAIVVPAIVVAIWGVWAAPKSKFRLQNPYRSVLKIMLCLLAAFLYYKFGKPIEAFWYAVFVFINAGLAFWWKQDY
jgi:hypothetical protein